jgi:hypothetical protein
MELRDVRARWWLAGAAVPIGLVTFAVTWLLFADEGDELGTTLLLWMAPALIVLALVRLPSWAFRLAAAPILFLELVFGAFGPLLWAVLLLHLIALFTKRPPPLGDLRAA